METCLKRRDRLDSVPKNSRRKDEYSYGVLAFGSIITTKKLDSNCLCLKYWKVVDYSLLMLMSSKKAG